MSFHLHRTHPSQQGVAIIMALFIMALVATMAYAMMARLDRDIGRTDLMLKEMQAVYYAQASVAWAMDQLKKTS